VTDNELYNRLCACLMRVFYQRTGGGGRWGSDRHCDWRKH